ncbi:hypothetical protein, partial [Parabacteroides distasonis]|uniref:hypothetical protein n=1 Tax=Parabacteroides distasonis TaxID=823 RepID=UPI00232DF7BE
YRLYRSHLGIQANTRLDVLQSFIIPVDRLFFQPGTLFRIFSDNVTGRFWSLVKTIQTEFLILFFCAMHTNNYRGTSCGNEPVRMDSDNLLLRLGILHVPS